MSTLTPQKILRFAHPYYNPDSDIAKVENTSPGMHLTDYVQKKLLPIPNPITGREPIMKLEEIIGSYAAEAIYHNGEIKFHTVGDTGHENGQMQEFVADAMALDYDTKHPESSPAFFLHLGDVIYYDNTDRGYQSQFYVPYKKYPGKIIGIPGNHDGEIFKYNGAPTGQKTSLEAFQRNFCQTKAGVPPDAGTIYREMISQPAVYWWLDAPLVDIVALYSNIGEGPGFISGKIVGQKQKDWLVKTLKAIGARREKGTRKALLIAVHHPPFSSGGHSSSNIMLADIDDACNQAGVMPDALLSAHSHNYQRFTRTIKFNDETWNIPYYVVGTGGRGLVPVAAPSKQATGDHILNESLMGYGYLTVTVRSENIQFDFTQVADDGTHKPFDKTVTVDFKKHTIS